MSQVYKKIAMTLHDLHKHDRKWLLERLPSTIRGNISSIVGELEVLGANGISSAEILATDPAHPNRESTPADSRFAGTGTTGEGRHDALMQAGVETIADILVPEPDWVIAVVVASREWPWLEGLVQRIPAERIDRLRTLVPRAAQTVRPVVTTAVLQALTRKLARDAGESAPPFHFDELVRHFGARKPAGKVGRGLDR